MKDLCPSHNQTFKVPNLPWVLYCCSSSFDRDFKAQFGGLNFGPHFSILNPIHLPHFEGFQCSVNLETITFTKI